MALLRNTLEKPTVRLGVSRQTAGEASTRVVIMIYHVGVRTPKALQAMRPIL